MTITRDQIKILASEVMADTPDGGGRRTSVVVEDGVAGNIFPMISRTDSFGRVNLREVFAGALTNSREVYAGAHAAIMAPPDNANIHANLFTVPGDYADRTAARDKIESYVISGPESRLVLVGRHIAGMQELKFYQRPEAPLPDIGDVKCLSKETGSTTYYQQYVRLGSLRHEIITCVDDDGEFKVRIINCKIGAPLRYEFAGPATPMRKTNVQKDALVRDTTVADAAKYYGIKPAAGALTHGALDILLTSIYSPIVPATNAEVPLSNVELSSVSRLVAAASASETVIYDSVGVIRTATVRFGRAFVPGSVLITAPTIGYSWHDDATGGTGVGTVDYETGVVNLLLPAFVEVTRITVTAIPAVKVSQPTHTRSVQITLGTVGTVYAETLLPRPAPGTLSVSFRSLARWYTLQDQGDGTLSGSDASYGAGSVDYATGAVVVTLGALPDIESAVNFAWGSPAHYTVRANSAAAVGPHIKQVLQAEALPLSPNTLTVAWVSGGVAKTASDAGGSLVGDATGHVNRTTGRVEIAYGVGVPDPGTPVTLTYTQLVPGASEPTFTNGTVSASNPASVDLGNVITPGGLYLVAPTSVGRVEVVDDGGGNIVTAIKNSAVNPGVSIAAGQVFGTVDYVTGTVAFAGTITGTANLWGSSQTGGAWASSSDFQISPRGGEYSYSISTGSAASDNAVTLEVPATDAPLRICLTHNITDQVVPNSVRFNALGDTFIERDGSLFSGVSPATGSGMEAGIFDYLTGEALVAHWTTSSAVAVTVASCLTTFGIWTATRADFRTAGSPLRPASLYVQVSDTTGALITATADQNGDITGARARGKINQTMGNAAVEFGALVLAAGNETQPWYAPANVVDGHIWQPAEVLPSTLRYNAVVQTNLPLDADLLGLDPVRLPLDGRVPIFRAADIIIIHHTAATELLAPAAGAGYSVGRLDLARIWLVDADGKKLPEAMFTVDLALGTVVLADPLDLTGYASPISARHRIEEMARCTAVNINGAITIASPLQRDFPAGTYVSSALVFGDLAARVANIHDQLAWTGVWSDTTIGDPANAQYNSIDYRPAVTNEGAEAERWRFSFTSSTGGQVIGESRGVISAFITNADCAPVNPLTGYPYFVVRAAGWGEGWVPGNQFIFDTISATPPHWHARTILPGAALTGDGYEFEMRGDVEA